LYFNYQNNITFLDEGRDLGCWGMVTRPTSQIPSLFLMFLAKHSNQLLTIQALGQIDRAACIW
jgi:hypothetical protein